MEKHSDSHEKKINGQNVCKKCGALLPHKTETCLVCGTNQKNNSSPSHHTLEPNEPMEVISSYAMHRQKRFARVVAGILMIVLLISGLSTGASQYVNFQQMKKQYNTKQAVLYQQNNSNLKISLPNFPEPFLIRNDFETNLAGLNKNNSPITVKDSHDKRFIAYLNNQTPNNDGVRGKLFLLDLSRLGNKDQEKYQGVSIASSSVVDFAFSPKEELLIYLTTEGDLFLCDYSNLVNMFNNKGASTQKIAENIGGIVAVSGQQILFYKGENTTPKTLENNHNIIAENKQRKQTTPFDLFSLSLSRPTDEPTYIDTDITDIVDMNADMTQIIYTKQSSPAPLPTYTLCTYDTTKTGEEPKVQILAENTSHVVLGDATSGKLLYLIPNNSSLTYDSLFSDEYQAIDKSLQNPTTSTTTESVADQVLQEQKYQEKTLRDRFRSHVKRYVKLYEDDHVLSYQLFYKPSFGEDAQLISKEIIGLQPLSQLVQVSDDHNYVLFVTSHIDRMQKRELGQLDSETMELFIQEPFNVTEYLAEHLPESLMLYNLSTDTSYPIFSEAGGQTLAEYHINSLSKEIYFISHANYSTPTGTLYSVAYSTNGVDRVVYVDDMVEATVGVSGGPIKGIIYQTLTGEMPQQRNLLLSNTDGITKIASDISPVNLTEITGENKDNLLYFKYYNEDTKIGTLYQYKDNVKKIENNTHQYLYINNNEMIIVEQAPEENKKLYRIKNGEKTYFDENINSYSTFETPFKPTK